MNSSDAVAASTSSIDAFSLIALTILIGSVIGIILYIRKTVQDQAERNRILEQNFETSILAELSRLDQSPESAPIPLIKSSPISETSIPETENFSVPVQSAGIPATSAALATGFRIDEAAKKILDQFRNANLSDGIFDFVAFHGNPQYGLSFRLKNGKTIVVLPAVESEAFQRIQVKRFDFIIVLDRENNGLITTSVESFIAEKFVL